MKREKKNQGLEEKMYSVITNVKLSFYQNMFRQFKKKEGSLTVIETICAEAIFALNKPTINELAEFIHISQPNAAYKVGNLVRKGYAVKTQNEEDRRSYKVDVTKKFLKDYGSEEESVKELAEQLRDEFTKGELDILERVLEIIDDKIVPDLSEYEGYNEFED